MECKDVTRQALDLEAQGDFAQARSLYESALYPADDVATAMIVDDKETEFWEDSLGKAC